uniref:Uncharacterized protein n=1 Tax=Ascaris lumbricoides TaxID=6252 RepID=A0A9J2P975_ASCLU
MEDEDRLVIDMFHNYNHLIRPVQYVNSTPVIVEFGIAMILLINVDEKNQIMQTNIWLTLKWNDFQFHWDPSDYGGITSVRVPQDKVWVPDIVLFNNADGNYEVSFRSNVNVESNGDVMWVPPAIYKSSCRIDVEYFPFDEQICMLIFGSWTYGPNEVQLSWYNNKEYVELNDYSYSGIWDVMDVPGQLAQNASKVVFNIVIRRKTLFYTVILIIPTVLMAFLSMMVFYLPAECSEKITLSISILLALVVFLLLVSKILPPTSDTIPLMAKYLLLTFVLNIITIMVTVVIINVYFRSARTHTMPQPARRFFLRLLPHLLMMKRPERIPIFNGYFVEEYCASDIFDASLIMPSMPATIVPFMRFIENTTESQRHQVRAAKAHHHKNCDKWSKLAQRWSTRRNRAMPERLPMNELRSPISNNNNLQNEVPSNADGCNLSSAERISHELKTTIESIAFIAEHMKAEMADKKERDDWKYLSMVIDRLLLVTFFGITLGVLGSEDEERLITDLFRGYNHLVRPVHNVSSRPIEIAFSLAMVLLINVDEKNQIMQTNVWPTMRWIDYQMRWDPREYANIQTIRVPPDKVWLPDIVLFNNADGNYEVSFYSNVVVEHTGDMLWVPPAIYKSSCTIDVEFFPFDEQTCAMIFGSWTFNKDEASGYVTSSEAFIDDYHLYSSIFGAAPSIHSLVPPEHTNALFTIDMGVLMVTINYLTGKRQVELNDYSPSGIWDVMDVPGELIQSKSKIAYQIRIRSMMVFYLPAEASEKITLAISILLALVVFLLLVSKILPPTSSTIPLMAKYLLMTFVMNIITILRPDMEETHRQHHINKAKRRRKRGGINRASNIGDAIFRKYEPGEFIEMSHTKVHHPYCSVRRIPAEEATSLLDARGGEMRKDRADVHTEIATNECKENENRNMEDIFNENDSPLRMPLGVEALRAIDAIEYITDHLRRENRFKRIQDEWKYVAMVIDRLLLYVFFAVTAGGTMGILFSAPNVFEYVNQTAVIEMLQKSAEAEMQP